MIPKLRGGEGLTIRIDVQVTVDAANTGNLRMEITQVLEGYEFAG